MMLYCPVWVLRAGITRAWIFVSTHNSRPPTFDSHSHSAARRDVLAEVLCTPSIVEPDRSRSRATVNPFAISPGNATTDDGDANV